MKLPTKTLYCALFLTSLSTYAAEQGQNQSQSLNNLSQYLQNLGLYLGYDITGYCPQTGGICPPPSQSQQTPPLSNNLLNTAVTSGYQLNLMGTVLGSYLPTFPANQTNPQSGTFSLIPSSSSFSGYTSLFNTYANKTFPSYNSTSTTTPSVTNLVDQAPFQNDPVSQAILNMLSTPDSSYCKDSNGNFVTPCNTGLNNTTSQGGGPVLSQSQVMLNVVGALPATGYFPLPANNQQLVSQLSSDSLVGPLMFNNSSQQSGSSTSTGSNQGLTAPNQVQSAANFIRYASGIVSPFSMPSRADYDATYNAATALTDDPTYTAAQRTQAQTNLASMITNIRVFSAQTSVGLSNLYYIFSKRMPQTAASSDQTQTSQAMSEFTMATWRLYSPTTKDSQGNTQQQWITSINQASSATVQKEIAVLLAEINYQLYLSRQQQERILLTNTMLLFQNNRVSPPNTALSGTATGGGSSTDSSS